ncbi:hypothetical protein LINGRAHAP2_LOCUS13388 [Linum grandiflorum]
MEQNGLFSGGGITSSSAAMLGLDIPLHQQQIPQNNPLPPQQQHNFQHHNPPMGAPAAPAAFAPVQLQPAVKQNQYPPFASSSHPKSPLSDDDDCVGDDGGDPKKKMSPWQRMKWTDGMVRLLIMAVYYIGDEVGTEVSDPVVSNSGSGKKKQSGAGLSQKKGKWKSVSRAMLEKGYYVSPQQCEDKFNDLNKRYKRVNDILGRGTACKVVENQALLDTMDLSPKMKEEVRKLLSSKHLFFKEMCAYHNSCGHGPTSGDATHQQQHQHPQHGSSQILQQQKCSHSENSGHMVANSTVGKRVIHEDDDDDDEDESHDDEYDDDEDYEDGAEGHSRGQNSNASHGHEEDGHDTHKRPRRTATDMMQSPTMQEFNGELISVVQDGSKSPWEKKQWMKMRLLQLEEQQVSYQAKSLEIEKQRMKWVKFAGKKEREMERAKLENERKRIENERMMLFVRQKELDLQHHHQQQPQLCSNRRSDPSSLTGC